MVIDLVSNDRQAVFLGHVEDLTEVLLVVDGAAGVGGVVHQDGRGVVVDEGLHVGDVDFPVVLGQEIVLLDVDPHTFGESGVEGEAGAGDEDVLSRVGEDADAEVETVGAAGADDDIVGVDLGAGAAHVISDGGGGLGHPHGGGVAVVFAGFDGVLDGFDEGVVGLEVAKDRGVPDGEGDHLLGRVGLQVHLLEDVPYGVESLFRQLRGLDVPSLLLFQASHLGKALVVLVFRDDFDRVIGFGGFRRLFIGARKCPRALRSQASKTQMNRIGQKSGSN